jgi:hypothetical protein
MNLDSHAVILIGLGIWNILDGILSPTWFASKEKESVWKDRSNSFWPRELSIKWKGTRSSFQKYFPFGAKP